MSPNDLSSEERLLRAMITLNAIKNGKSPPNFDNISNGWITRIDVDASTDKTLTQIREKMNFVGWSTKPERKGLVAKVISGSCHTAEKIWTKLLGQ